MEIMSPWKPEGVQCGLGARRCQTHLTEWEEGAGPQKKEMGSGTVGRGMPAKAGGAGLQGHQPAGERDVAWLGGASRSPHPGCSLSVPQCPRR